LECAFGVDGKILLSRIQWNLLVRFGFRMWEIVISGAENSNKFQKSQVFQGKIS
jgi:hypothetical protein